MPEGGDILSDRIGLLPQGMARSRRNPFTDPLRAITVRTATGKIIRLEHFQQKWEPVLRPEPKAGAKRRKCDKSIS